MSFKNLTMVDRRSLRSIRNESVKSFVNYYAPQVKIYSRFWEEITKQPIKEAGLYFTSINKWVAVK